MFVRFSRLAALFEIESALSSTASTLFLILTALLVTVSALLAASTMSLAMCSALADILLSLFEIASVLPIR